LRVFLRFFLLFVFLAASLYAQAFREVRNISLKKDEQKKILVKYATNERLFKMRWTLYTDGALVVFRSYDRIVGQNILSLRDKNSSFRLYLKPQGEEQITRTYLLVRFKKFDFEKNEAVFELLLSDKKRQIELKELQ